MPQCLTVAQISIRIRAAGGLPSTRILAVSKTQAATAVRALAEQGQRHFGENYVQEARAKMSLLGDLALCWHLIGPLQSNKCRDVAEHFDWLESLDREKLIPLLARFRPADATPLKVLVQVNIDGESGKSGCSEDQAARLCDQIAAHPSLCLRGLMAIPAPEADLQLRRVAFRRMRQLYDTLRATRPTMDTLSMGMSEDFELAVSEGATQVRIGSALFGPRDAGQSALASGQ